MPHKKISKRVKLLSLSFLATVFWLVTLLLASNFFLSLIFLSLFLILGLIWILQIRNPVLIFFSASYPFLLSYFSLALSRLLLPVAITWPRPLVIFLGALLYFLVFHTSLLAINILNVALVRPLPLKKAAQSAFFLLGMVLVTLMQLALTAALAAGAINLIIYFTLAFVGQAWILLLLVWGTQIQTSQFHTERSGSQGGETDLNEHFGQISWGQYLDLVLAAALLSAEANLLVIVIKAPILIKSLFVAVIFFVLASFTLNQIQRTLTKRVIYEYAFLICLTTLILLF